MAHADDRTVVVTGAAGSVGRVAIQHLADRGWTVHGADRRAEHDAPDGVTFHRVDIRKRGFEDLLKRVRPNALLHLARVRGFDVGTAERHRVNFEGTVRVVQTAIGCRVRKVVFASRHTVYGALPDQPQFLTEDHPPAAGRTFPEIQDLVAADLYTSGMLWRHPDVELVVLRPVNVVGATVNTLLSRYLGRSRVFTVAGFDPVYQVLHEDDLARAFEHALRPGLRGVFNVTGPGEVPLHVLVDSSGATRIPLPEPMIRVIRGRLGFPHIPQGAIDFLKYACTVDGARFADQSGFSAAHDLRSTVAAIASRARG